MFDSDSIVSGLYVDPNIDIDAAGRVDVVVFNIFSGFSH